VALSGVLRDRQGVVAVLGEVLDVCAGFSVEAGQLPQDYHAKPGCPSNRVPI